MDELIARTTAGCREPEELLKYQDDPEVKERLFDIKLAAKRELKNYLKETQNVEIDENSVFDIQIKRLHEYSGSR